MLSAHRGSVTAVALLAAAMLPACTELKSAGKTIGTTTKEVATEIGHGTRDAAKDVAAGTKRVLEEAAE